MSTFAWISGVDSLGAAVLTAKAQLISPTDVDGLLWPGLFPRQNVDTTKLAHIAASVDFRPVADRREWNQRGREIPLKTPDISTLEMVPIEAKFGIMEKEINDIRNAVIGNEALFRQIVGVRINDRIDGLAKANFRRIEKDSFDAWTLGQIVIRDPQGGTPDETISLGFAAGRYVTPSAWTGGSTGTAFAQLKAHIALAEDLGLVSAGAMLRTSTLTAVQESAPRPVNDANSSLTLLQVRDRIEQDIGRAFNFFKNEQTLDVFSDGGTTTVRTKKFPSQTVALIPEGGVIGSTFFAPVSRAWDLASSLPNGAIDIRGNTVYPEEMGNGRGLSVECQVNALPFPDEQNVYVITAGI